MILEEVRLVPPEEIERARLEAEQPPETDVDDAGEQLQKVEFVPEPKDPTERFIWALRRQFPEIAEGLKSAQFVGGRVMGPVPVSQMIEVVFTSEQYAELGCPPLLSILKVSMRALSTGSETDV